MSQRSRTRDVVYRLLAAVAGGLAVAGIANLCVYYDQRGEYGFNSRVLATQEKLDSLQQEIDKHRRTTGQLPSDLAELPAVAFYHKFSTNAEGRVIDSWGHPYQYRVEGDGFELYSFGADGQPGGSGRDADLYPGPSSRPLELPSLRQFTFELKTEGVRRTCIVAGVCAALVSLLVTRKRKGAALLARTAATVFVFIIIAVAWSGMQVPTSH